MTNIYEIEVVKVSYGHRTIKLEADNIQQARERAEKIAHKFEFKGIEGTTTYKAVNDE